jgi:hypothetical protein
MNSVSETDERKIQEWNKLLCDFETLVFVDKTPQLKQLLNEFDAQQTNWRKEQEYCADNFNILRTMGVGRKELCHSDILAWLLDQNETHAQGNLGFRLFLKELNLPNEFASKKYRVVRELCGEESRIDIVIEAEGEFVIGIENKIDSEEGEDQTKREWNDLEKRKTALRVPTDIMAFFLTPDGSSPGNPKFQPLSWHVIANIFQAFSEESKAELVRIFAKHYAETLRHDIVSENED